jgi:RNA polymerase sigma-54 factor
MSELSQNLALKQQQRLVMTPQLKQALKILQMNTVELSELLEAELAENPMLEELGEEGAEGGSEVNADGVDAATFEEGTQPTESTSELTLEGPEGHDLDDWDQYFDDDGTDYSLAKSEQEAGEEKQGFEAFFSRPETLQEHLLAQLDAEELDETDRALCEEIIGRVDERGYLEGDLDAIAAETGAPREKVFAALRRVQRMDPPGVAARDLRECLLLQLEARGQRGSLAWRAVEDHFDDVTHRRWQRLAGLLKADAAEIAAAASLVASLEPLPGRPFGGAPNAGVPVDASVEKDPLTGAWRVVINDGGLPRLGFNAYYKRLMRHGGALDAETRAWLKEKQQSALWLMRGVQQRHRTLRRVLEEIVAVQSGFFEQGPAAFQPLTLKDIANRTGLHESTISRVTTGKYVQTPRGVFELKYFFTSALRTDTGGETSSRAVKDRLRELVREEDPAKPLSDQELAERLSAEGIKIARRTVAKYREELHLPPAHLRRKS